MEITGAHVLGEVMHVARHSRELMLIGKKKKEKYRRKTSMKWVEDKGYPRRSGRVNREIKEKSEQTKSGEIIGNELPALGAIHAEEKCHI